MLEWQFDQTELIDIGYNKLLFIIVPYKYNAYIILIDNSIH